MHKKKPNRLLQGLVGVSLAIHLLILMHVFGIYRSTALSYIEMTLQNVSKPSARSIPRPRHRPKDLKPEDVKRLKVSRRSPTFKPIKVEPVEKNLPDTLMEGIGMPDIPDTPGLNVANWNPGELTDSGDAEAIYLEMVRLKIERHKKYPETAKARQIEGFVTVRFVITPQGDVLNVEIVKSSRQKSLDKAALRAIHAAAPFPVPPQHLFKGEIPLELTIAFELM
ncbi:MAG: energy transducer TonB [Deltaproteobacteria bacterium]|nr:energy transducer TonB [Deltaproteobacteria bacterium]